MSRQVRIASVDGRPSRRKNEPGMRPTAYIRSSTSTVSGKKSKCSLGVLPAVVADRTVVSPSWTITEPAACLASRPVEKTTSRVPNEPLSITAVRVSVPRAFCSVMWCGTPSSRTRRSLQRGYSVAGLRSKCPGFSPGTTTEDRCRLLLRPRGSGGEARGSGHLGHSPVRSSAQAETLDQRPVARDVLLLYVV